MKRWIDGFECMNCGSTMGRLAFSPRLGREEPWCFCCGIPQSEAVDMIQECEDFEDVIVGSGFQTGASKDIIVKTNVEWMDHSTNAATQNSLGSAVSFAFDNTPELKACSPQLRAQILALTLSPLGSKIRNCRIGDKNDPANKKNNTRQRSARRKNGHTK